MLNANLSLAIAASCIFSAYPLIAGPLTSAEVTKIINRVSVVDPEKGAHPAIPREVIKDDLGLQTGTQSRSELLFQDNTLTRIGSDTFFSFKTGTRDMTLEKGSMLLQVPKGLGGAKIHTAAVTAAITGTTIMMEYVPDQYIKVLVLEGSLRVSRNGSFGDSLLLKPGKMVIMRPDAKKIPEPVDVDLEHIVKTSSLVNFPGADPLPSTPLIQAAIVEQSKRVAKSDLVPTNLVMGHGTKVILASNDQLAKTLGPIGLPSASLGGGPIASVKGITGTLPIIGPVTSNTLTVATTTVNNLLSSTGILTNGLLGASPTAPAVSVTSSTQLLALLSSAAPGPSGIITIGATVAAVPAAILPSSPVASSASTLPAISTITLPVLPSTTAITAVPTTVLTTVTSAPTTALATATIPIQLAPTISLPLGH
jgi:hypothetical protein